MKKHSWIISISLILCLLVAGLSACAVKPNPDEIADKALEYFYEISKIPRGSDNEQAISDYLVAFAEENGLMAVQDKARNVLITKPGSVGREDEPPVILQAHLDMVCEKNTDSNHNFLTDPIIPIIDGDWLMADGTTLGADNGSGLAIIMAVLAAADLSHPPIEAIMTANEDGGTGPGASEFNTSQLEGKRFINLDSEEYGALTVCCGGTAGSQATIREEYAAMPQGYTAYALAVNGLAGGHSAVDIDKDRANAIIVMACVLNALDDNTISLISIKGGTVINAIPRDCVAVIAFAESDLPKNQSVITQIETALKTDYPGENITLTLEKTEAPPNIMTHDTMRKVINLIVTTPNGVLAMSPDFAGLVRTSSNIGLIDTVSDLEFQEGKIQVTVSKMLRSASVEELDFLIKEIDNEAKRAGALLSEGSMGASPWQYQEDSPLRNTMTTIYTDMFGEAPVITGAPGYLECGIFAEKMPDCDFIAIGPTIENAHSPSERMNLPSFKKTCSYLVKVLEAL